MKKTWWIGELLVMVLGTIMETAGGFPALGNLWMVDELPGLAVPNFPIRKPDSIHKRTAEGRCPSITSYEPHRHASAVHDQRLHDQRLHDQRLHDQRLHDHRLHAAKSSRGARALRPFSHKKKRDLQKSEVHQLKDILASSHKYDNDKRPDRGYKCGLECLTHSECKAGRKCCETPCGYSCQDIVFYDEPAEDVDMPSLLLKQIYSQKGKISLGTETETLPIQTSGLTNPATYTVSSPTAAATARGPSSLPTDVPPSLYVFTHSPYTHSPFIHNHISSLPPVALPVTTRHPPHGQTSLRFWCPGIVKPICITSTRFITTSSTTMATYLQSTKKNPNGSGLGKFFNNLQDFMYKVLSPIDALEPRGRRHIPSSGTSTRAPEVLPPGLYELSRIRSGELDSNELNF